MRFAVLSQTSIINEKYQILTQGLKKKKFEEILGTRAFQRYVDTPIQTLDGIVVNQPKHFLPLAQEAKKIAKEIRIEKINEQWAGIP